MDGFPKLNKLENLILELNQLDGSAVTYISKNFKKLTCLSLAENKISTFEVRYYQYNIGSGTIEIIKIIVTIRFDWKSYYSN